LGRFVVDESVVSTTVTNASGAGNRFSFLRSRSRNWFAVALYSAALLIPCFWQSRIQAADLPSHIYNAWLASLIQKGSAPGLWLSFQSNNVLFDVILEWLLSRVGPEWAQRLAVSFSVLVFAWGAIFFTLRFAGRLASGNADRESRFIAVPCVAMLSYGFIFHMGFFNFYLSMGLCLCYLALSWARERSWQIRVLAAPVLIVAWIAHPFPVVWAVGSAVYIAAASGLTPSRRGFLVALGMAALIAARYILTHRYSYSWSWRQLFFATGATQIELFGLEYALPFAGLLSIWWLLLRSLVKRIGLMHLMTAIPFQLWLLNGAAVLLIPDRVMFPQFGLPFGYITDRLSLGSGLMMCAIVAAAPSTRVLRAALVSVTVLFFGLLYADNRELNQLEDRLDAVVARMPPGQRLLSSLSSESLRSLCLQHDLERACIGHCFSYANYEPSSRQFRVRARPGNGLVLADYAAVNAVADGSYVVQPRDLPVYLVYPCGLRLSDVCSRPLQAGEAIGKQK
jgi:hypothetical protein